MKKNTLFSILSPKEKKIFLDLNYHKELSSKEQLNILSCLGILCVVHGSLRVFLTTETGREITLFKLLPKDICIMSAPCLMGDSSFNIFIEASQDSTIEIIPKFIIEKLSDQNPQFTNLLLTLTGEKMEILLGIINDLLVKKIDVRIASLLLEGGGLSNTTHEEIANHIGSSREVVSRVLKHMKSMGIVEFKRKVVTIKDLDKLKLLIRGN